ncbi:MAG: hypothetical protein MR902_07530 [Campylobacter sp.]|nr:hypothetical protein [Campylobacter sp.]
MKYNKLDILYFFPLLSPDISIDAGFSFYGKEKLAKYDFKPNARSISHKYYLRNLSQARWLENFFLDKQAMLKSFYIPSYKRDFLVYEKASAPVSAINIKNTNGGYAIYNQSRFIFIPEFNFATQILDIRKDTKKNCEVMILKDELNRDINEDTLIMELINVRFDSDTFTLSKNGAVGFSLSLKFKEIFYE